jgi:hypothetical protein
MSGKPSKPSTATPKPATVIATPEVKQSPPRVSALPSASVLGLGDHYPKAIDLRPYAIGSHPVAAALSAALTKCGSPLPFAPSGDHIEALAALGDIVDGLNVYGVREAYTAIVGRQATAYDLEADAIKLNVKAYVIDSKGEQKIKDVCAAFANGHAVKFGTSFLVAYHTGENGPTFVLNTGSTFDKLIEAEKLHVWKVERR